MIDFNIWFNLCPWREEAIKCPSTKQEYPVVGVYLSLQKKEGVMCVGGCGVGDSIIGFSHLLYLRIDKKNLIIEY